MDLKIFLVATIAMCLKLPESHGRLYHTPRHHCIPPLDRQLHVPIIYSVPGAPICAIICSRKNCYFFEFSDPDVCQIYGVGLESTNVYVDTEVAAPPAGGSLKEMAKGKTAYSSGAWNAPANAVDDDLNTRFEGGGYRPWWMVDLGANYIVHFVDILPRPGGFAFRFQKVEVRAGPIVPADRDLSLWEFIGLYPGVYSGTKRVHFNSSQGVCGRFVSAQHVGELVDAFALNDVEVYVRERNP
ncbi:uncharacterized protein [Palaemon carinicauda]|uniref:uncharacterized protein n=1 Tax=Palaemon carinicauda TaxID=392227 RepID=UPI0035B592AB